MLTKDVLPLDGGHNPKADISNSRYESETDIRLRFWRLSATIYA